MPVLQHETTIRAGKGSSTLKLGVTHSLHFGVDCKLEADANTVIRTPLPYFVDVHSCSDLAITLRVVLDGQLLDKDNTFKKAIDQHFISTLRQNTTLLGINTLSDTCITACEDDLKVIISPQRSKATIGSHMQAILKSIQLSLYWKDINNTLDLAALGNTLNGVLEKFMCNELVRHYPLIFGTLEEKRDIEDRYHLIISRCLVSIASRSENLEFRQQVNRQLRLLRKNLVAINRNIFESMRLYDISLGATNAFLSDVLDNSDTGLLCAALHNLWKSCIQPPLIKFTLVSDILAKKLHGTQSNANISLKDGVTVATIVPQHAENGSLLERDLDLDFGFDYFRNYTDQTSIDQSSLSPVDPGIMASPDSRHNNVSDQLPDQQPQVLDYSAIDDDDMLDSPEGSSSQCSDYAESVSSSIFCLSLDAMDKDRSFQSAASEPPATGSDLSTLVNYEYNLSGSELGFTSGEETCPSADPSIKRTDSIDTVASPFKVCSPYKRGSSSREALNHLLDLTSGSEDETGIGFCKSSGDYGTSVKWQEGSLALSAAASYRSHGLNRRAGDWLRTEASSCYQPQPLEKPHCFVKTTSFRPSPDPTADDAGLSNNDSLESEDEILMTHQTDEANMLETDSDQGSVCDWM